MPGRKRTPLAVLFKDVTATGDGKVTSVKCVFCCSEIAKNGTRMANHIAGCKNCDDKIKLKYLPKPKTRKDSDKLEMSDYEEASQETDETVEIIERYTMPMDMEDSVQAQPLQVAQAAQAAQQTNETTAPVSKQPILYS
jgi:hypothetical protein